MMKMLRYLSVLFFGAILLCGFVHSDTKMSFYAQDNTGLYLTADSAEYLALGQTIYSMDKGKIKWSYQNEAKIIGAEILDNKDIVIVSPSIFSASIKILDAETGEIAKENNEAVTVFGNTIPIIATGIAKFSNIILVTALNKVYKLNNDATLTELYQINGTVGDIKITKNSIIIRSEKSLHALDHEFKLINKIDFEDYPTNLNINDEVSVEEYTHKFITIHTFDYFLNPLSQTQKPAEVKQIQENQCEKNSYYINDQFMLLVNNTEITKTNGTISACIDKEILFVDENNYLTSYNPDSWKITKEYKIPWAGGLSIVTKELIIENTSSGIKLYKKGKADASIDIIPSFSEIVGNSELTMQTDAPFKYTYKNISGNLNLDKDVSFDKIEVEGDLDADGYTDIALYPKKSSLKAGIVIFTPETKELRNINFVPTLDEANAKFLELDKNITDLNKLLIAKGKINEDLDKQMQEYESQISQYNSELTTKENQKEVKQAIYDSKVTLGLDANTEKKEINSLNNDISKLKEKLSDVFAKKIEVNAKKEKNTPEIYKLEIQLYKLIPLRKMYSVETEEDLGIFFMEESTVCGQNVFAKLKNGFFYKYDLKTDISERVYFLENLVDVNNIYIYKLACLPDIDKKGIKDLMIVNKQKETSKITALSTENYSIIWDKTLDIEAHSINYLFKYSFGERIFLPANQNLYIYNGNNGTLVGKISGDYSKALKAGQFFVLSSSNSSNPTIVFTQKMHFEIPMFFYSLEGMFGTYDCDEDGVQDLISASAGEEVKIFCYNTDLEKTIKFGKEDKRISVSGGENKIKVTDKYLTILNYGSLPIYMDDLKLNTIIDLKQKKIVAMSAIGLSYKNNKVYLGTQEFKPNTPKIISSSYDTQKGIKLEFNSQYTNIRKIIYFNKTEDEWNQYYNSTFYDSSLVKLKTGTYKITVVLAQNNLFVSDSVEISTYYKADTSTFALISFFGILLGGFIWVILKWIRH